MSGSTLAQILQSEIIRQVRIAYIQGVLDQHGNQNRTSPILLWDESSTKKDIENYVSLSTVEEGK